MLSHLSLLELKDLMKAMNSEEKRAKKGLLRKFYLSAENVTMEHIMQFMRNQDKYAQEQLSKEKERCKAFLYNEEERVKYGWDLREKSQDKNKLMEWADKAYPQRNIALYEVEFEKALVLSTLQNQ